jgi:Protein of unknown function (DUF3788)
MGRSSAYWASNLYPAELQEPEPTAPFQDLTPALASRFKLVREGLLQIPGVAEQVRYMGVTWRWAWEYGMGNRKLCWLHLMKGSIDATFTVSEGDESRLAKGGKIAGAIARSLLEGQRTGPVKWCWLELSDRRSIDAFLSLARRKAEWLSERPAPRRAPRLHRRRGGEAAETD